MIRFLVLIIFFFAVRGFGQDTVTVMQYNLLWYGETTDWCNNSNNNINDKDEYIKTIIDYIQPDIFAVNEISKSPSIHHHLLDQVLNSDGINYYKKADFKAVAESDIVNMLYYNSAKLALHSHLITQSYIRDIDLYKLYHLNEGLLEGDTSFIICVVAHLKASSGTTNENKRKVMANNSMDFLNGYDDDNNYMMMGDFNVYSASEPAYQEFLNYSNASLRFIDPVDQYGEWHNNYYFRNHHTQSTHENSNNCASGGGMDDRFDFILISENIKKGSKQVKYLPGSYRAVGQDGKHFNTSINASPANTSVPSNVLQALFNNSDHLPVVLKLLVGKNVGIEHSKPRIDLTLENPVRDHLNLSIYSNSNESYKLELVDLSGKIQFVEQNLKNGSYSFPVTVLQKGFYLLRITNGNLMIESRKVIKL